MEKIKLLYLTPHLSTGGMPQFVLKRIESLQKFKDKIEIFLVEYSQFSDTYVVQRNKIIELLGSDHFWTLGGTTEIEKKYQLIDILKNNNIDILHAEEIPEAFESFNSVPFDLLNQIYDNLRTWKIVETCHNVWFDANNKKKLHPDYYCLVTPYHQEYSFKNTPSPKGLLMYPYEDKVKPILEELEIHYDEHKIPLLKKIELREELGMDPMKTHVLNVGLWTSGKNQKEGIEVARLIENTHPDIHFHFIGNQAPNFEEYWKPIMENLPKNVTVWGERTDVDKFMTASDVLMFNSTWECNPLVIREAVNYGLKILTRNLNQYLGMFDNYITPILSDNCEEIKNTLLELISNEKGYIIEKQNDFGEELINFYENVLKSNKMANSKLENDYTFNCHFVVNPFFEILGNSQNNFDITFYDDFNNIIYNNQQPINHWVKLNRQYYTNWRIEVKENDNLVYNYTLILTNKRVYISFASKSLGDTMAWIPYCEEFRKKHNCQLIVSTFMNELFENQYPEIEFVNPGMPVNNIFAQYQIGWFFNEDGSLNTDIHKNDVRTQPLQKTATDILGLEYKEIRPELNLPEVQKSKKVGIGIHSTAQAKYWNNPNGWQEVVDYLNNLGYECVIYSKEGDGYMGNFHPKNVTKFKGGTLQEVIDDLVTCEFFIGLGSGLSWLAWACKLPLVLISGFSEKWAETTLDTYRVINESVCHGCFNKEKFDAGDWNWCPLHKGTDRQFECSKQISSQMVINEINKIIKVNPLGNFDWGWMDTNREGGEYHKYTMYNEIFEQRLYEKFFEVEEGDIVLDIGSSVGPFTYSILDKKPKHVFCIEPSESEFTSLIRNTIGYPVTHINKGISDRNGYIEHDQLFGGETHMETITFQKLINLYGLKKIDFIKTDCEGGEYFIFNQENLPYIKQNVKKIVGEWHLRSDEHKQKFRYFRDNILTQFENYEVFSVDGVDIKWDLFNEHFIEYYCEVIVYIKNY
jgi:autotransporter strand-loop-strand O-heptosyltransferase